MKAGIHKMLECKNEPCHYIPNRIIECFFVWNTSLMMTIESLQKNQACSYEKTACQPFVIADSPFKENRKTRMPYVMTQMDNANELCTGQ